MAGGLLHIHREPVKAEAGVLPEQANLWCTENNAAKHGGPD